MLFKQKKTIICLNDARQALIEHYQHGDTNNQYGKKVPINNTPNVAIELTYYLTYHTFPVHTKEIHHDLRGPRGAQMYDSP